MNERVNRLKSQLQVDQYHICTEKACLVMESFKKTEGQPEILRRAKATAHYLDNKELFIENDELIVGNVASKPMGMEAGSTGPTWSKEELDGLRGEGYIIAAEDEAVLRSFDDYWQGRTLWERMGQFYDDERLWPFIQSGILLPPWKSKTEGRGHGSAGVGWGLGNGQSLIVIDYEKVLDEGLNKIISDAEIEFKNIKFTDSDAMKKADYLKSIIIANKAIVRIAQRFSDLAAEMAQKENDANRKQELIRITEACSWVPANSPRSFSEAVQAFWFIWVMIGSGTASGGRFDQFMYPYYKRDKEKGLITDSEVLELLQCLQIKVMQLNGLSGGKSQREKWAGLARWNNWVIGGVTPDGNDATNELTYLLLETVKETKLPSFTLTLRVHENTPEELLLKALEVVKTGIGMPAFVGDESYLAYFQSHGVPLEDARDYALGGCLDGMLPGKSRTNATGMFIVPLVFELAINNGVNKATGKQLGPQTGYLENFETFDDLMRAFKEQLAHFMGLAAEEHNILLAAQRELFPDPVHSSFMFEAVKVGKDVNDRILPFENGSALNPVGIINVIDSLAAVKKLVFEEKKITLTELRSALEANWQGYDEIRKSCLSAPKYGNGDNYVDRIAQDIYQFWADTAVTLESAWGGTTKPSGISITAHGPGGTLVGATPDGRKAGENLCDGTVSASQGMDTNGPTALLRSAMSIDQRPYQSTLLNMKFHPSALKSTDDLRKLIVLLKTYFEHGGKHIQFNVVDQETLLNAQKNPAKHRDLIVRVAGYSAYFVQLNQKVQQDIISRTEYQAMA